jgi:hypothetical protein
MIIDDYMKYRLDRSWTLHDLQCFVGMLETGECTLAQFEERGIDLEQIARRFGSPNCWTGTSGELAARLLKCIQDVKGKPCTP